MPERGVEGGQQSATRYWILATYGRVKASNASAMQLMRDFAGVRKKFECIWLGTGNLRRNWR